MATKPLKQKEQHPKFIGGATDPSTPPYDFERVTLRYLPLKAQRMAATKTEFVVFKKAA